MSLTIIGMVLLAAVMHASWNAMVRTGADRLILIAIFMVGPGIMIIPFLPLVSLPTAEAWFYVALSVTIHTLYYLSLITAYKHGDLSHVYPVARGLAPVLVLVGGFLLVNETPSFSQLIGVLVISISIMSLAFENGPPWKSSDNRGFLFALLTSFLISAYTLTDGLGARAANNPMDYILWLFALEGWPIFIFALYLRRGAVWAYFKENTTLCVAGGLFSTAAYGIVIYALSLGLMAGVSALRETSVIIATLIGIFLFKEKHAFRRIVVAIIVTLGVILIHAN